MMVPVPARAAERRCHGDTGVADRRLQPEAQVPSREPQFFHGAHSMGRSWHFLAPGAIDRWSRDMVIEHRVRGYLQEQVPLN